MRISKHPQHAGTTPAPPNATASTPILETPIPGRVRRRTRVAASLAATLAALTIASCTNTEPSTLPETTQTTASAAGIDLEAAQAQESQAARAAALPSLPPKLATQREKAWNVEAPTMPDELYIDVPLGAQKATVAFLFAYRYAFMTGDTKLLANLSESQCSFCNTMITNAKDLHAQGGWTDYWNISIRRVEYWSPVGDSKYSRVQATVSMDEARNHIESGTTVVNASAIDDRVMIFAVRYSDGQWRIREVGFADE